MFSRKIIKGTLWASAFMISMGLSQEVKAATTIGSDVAVAGITPIMENYYSSNSENELGEAEEYLINLLQQYDQENGTNLTKILSPYANLGISIANNYVNIRSGPNTESEVVGKLYNGCATDILATEGDWVKIKSGNVEGYIKSDYLAIGQGAEELIEEVASKHATIKTRTLYVREEPNTESRILTMVPLAETYHVTQEQEGWAKILIDDMEGFVSKDYIDIEVEFNYAISIEEERAKIAAEEAAKKAERERLEKLAREEEARKAKKKTTSSKATTNKSTVQATSSEGTAKGREIANYALKFVGVIPYRYGTNNLSVSVDCSGFTQQVYKHFGYSLQRSSSAQSKTAGYKVKISDRQPGDLLFYSKGGRITHVAMYIGNNKVVHASNRKDGIKISKYNYRTPHSIRRIVK